jgi:iron-sulfur cluster insertion protein
MSSINITDRAISKIQEVLENQNKSYFRIRVKGGGCSGFQYVFQSESEINDQKDQIFEFGKLKVIIDKNSLPFIEAAELDYKDEMIGSSFSISNPNAKSSCGCGSSFSL